VIETAERWPRSRRTAAAAADFRLEIGRREVRARFEQRFIASRMAEDYVRHYEALVAGKPVLRAAFAPIHSPSTT